MKLKSNLLILISGLGLVTLMPSCESSGPSNTHEMGGPGKPRMDNSLMPNRGDGTGSGGSSGSNTHEMGGPRTPRMDNSIMPGRN